MHAQVKAESEAIAHGIKGILTAENLNARLAADGLCSGGMCVEFLEKAEGTGVAQDTHTPKYSCKHTKSQLTIHTQAHT